MTILFNNKRLFTIFYEVVFFLKLRRGIPLVFFRRDARASQANFDQPRHEAKYFHPLCS